MTPSNHTHPVPASALHAKNDVHDSLHFAEPLRVQIEGHLDVFVPEEEFELQFAPHLGVNAAGLIDRLFAGSGPDELMLKGVRRARAGGVRTGLVSNSWGTRRYPREVLAELFDGVVISGEVGIRKPAPEIYALGARSIGLDPEACVFVDDLPFNLIPAAELGMATVHHRTAEETLDELERLLAVNLR